MSTLAYLITRLEAATEGSIELDRLIWEAVAGEKARKLELPPCFTISLDDAISLVPEGYAWRIGKIHHGYTRDVKFFVFEASVSFQAGPGAPIERYYRHGKTMTLALCIAALKARIAMENKNV